MAVIVQFMEQRAGTSFDKMYYVTAEKSASSVQYRDHFYEQLYDLGFEIDIRGFKGKQAFCPNKECNMHRCGFNIQVQAEVDIAIVMKAMQHFARQQLSELTLLAGDGDFRDLVAYLKEENRKVNVFSYEDSHNEKLHKNSSQGYFLDGIWQHFSVPVQKPQNPEDHQSPAKNDPTLIEKLSTQSRPFQTNIVDVAPNQYKQPSHNEVWPKNQATKDNNMVSHPEQT